MRIHTIAAIAAASLMLSMTAAQAVFIPIGAPIIVAPTKGTPARAFDTGIHGLAYNGVPGNPGCPAAAAAGTCPNGSLSEASSGGVTAAVPGTKGSCTQPGVNVTLGGISGASKPC
jgi:hypothetical protein